MNRRWLCRSRTGLLPATRRRRGTRGWPAVARTPSSSARARGTGGDPPPASAGEPFPPFLSRLPPCPCTERESQREVRAGVGEFIHLFIGRPPPRVREFGMDDASRCLGSFAREWISTARLFIRINAACNHHRGKLNGFCLHTYNQIRWMDGWMDSGQPFCTAAVTKASQSG